MISSRRRGGSVLAFLALGLAARAARVEPPAVAVWHFGSHSGSESLWIRAGGGVELVGRDLETGEQRRALGRLSPEQIDRFAGELRESDFCHLPSSRYTAVAGQGLLGEILVDGCRLER
jgi:hypothetical protein